MAVLTADLSDVAGSSFAPTDIANLFTWHDVNNAGSLTVDGSNYITQWNDLSGNGFNLAPMDTGHAFIYTPNTQNGLPIALANSACHMRMDSTPFSLAGVSSTFACTGRIFSNGKYIPWMSNVNPWPVICEMDATGFWINVDGTNYVYNNVDYATPGFFCVVGETNTNGSNHYMNLWINGTLVASGDQTWYPYATGWDNFNQCGQPNPTATPCCWYAESIVYKDKVLTTTERNNLTTYLKTKWGIP